MRALPLVLLFLAACARDVGLPAPPLCTLTLQSEPGLDLSLAGDGGCPGTVKLRLRVATGATSAPSWEDAAASPVKVEGGWTLDGAAAIRTVTVKNSGSAPVTLLGLEWATPPEGLGLPADRLLNNGYQSWAYSGVLRIPATLKDSGGTAPHGGDNEDLANEQRGVSWWWTWVGDASGRGVVAGADGATVFKTFFAVDGAKSRRLRIVQGLTGDALPLAPGESVALDGLWLALGDAASRLDDYAAAVAKAHPPAAPRVPALGGWGSWNLYYALPTAAAMREEAAWARTTLAPLGLRDFLLDDGYEPNWGDWTAAPRFGAPLEVLNAEQAAAGLTPAVWLAPVYVDLVDPLVAQHPDWFVRRADGTLRTYANFGPTHAALDVTHPGARAFVTSSLQRLWAQGYRTFKLDFLFGAAVEGVRQEPVTGLQSYARWLKVIRAAVPGAHLVGCGAPLLPSVGHFDSMRTGADIAFAVSPEPAFALLASQARQTITRGFSDRWWALDPDVLLLRGTKLDEVEAWTAVVSAALAGGNYLLGDGRQAPASRLAMALAPELLAFTRDGRAARPLDFAAQTEGEVVVSPLLALVTQAETKAPHRWQKVSADGSRGVLAVFAWDEQDYQAVVAFPDGAEELLPPAGASAALGRRPMLGSQPVQVPRHGVRLFRW